MTFGLSGLTVIASTAFLKLKKTLLLQYINEIHVTIKTTSSSYNKQSEIG